MKRTDWKYLIDALLYICFVVIAFIGFLMGFVLGRGSKVPESSKYFLGLHRHDWGDIHFYFSITFIILVIIHLILSWSWIKGKSRNIFRKIWSFQLVFLVIAPFLLFLIIWSLYPRSPGEQSDYDPEGGKRSRVGINHKELRSIKEGVDKEWEEGKAALQKNKEEVEAFEQARIQEKFETGELKKLQESGEQQRALRKEPNFEMLISDEEALRHIVRANNSFGLAIYRDVSREKGNQFLSPLSLSTALAMTLEGGRGETALAIRKVLELPAEDSLRQSGFAQIRKLINQPGRKSNLRLANAVWVQKDFPVLKNYLEIIDKFYDGRASNVDFINRREEARKMINQWVEEKTAGKIKNLIPPGIIDHLTRLILTNAIYFRGLWLLPFNLELTRPEKFYLTEGEEVEVPMMRFLGDRARFPYMEKEDLQMLEMFYEGQDLSILLLLPRQRDISSLESKLTLEALEAWKSKLKEERVDVYLPRFKMETKYFLKDKLERMGMAIAFIPRADFSGINGRKDLFIKQVIHQAFVEVNEEGTEAAAATGVSISLTAYVPEKKYIFRADHPFLFLIQDKASGAILFLGRLSDPR